MEEIVLKVITLVCVFSIMVLLIIIADKVYKPKKHNNNLNLNRTNRRDSDPPSPPSPQPSNCKKCPPTQWNPNPSDYGVWTAGSDIFNCGACCSTDADTGKQMKYFSNGNGSAGCLANDGNLNDYCSEICGDPSDPDYDATCFSKCSSTTFN